MIEPIVALIIVAVTCLWLGYLIGHTRGYNQGSTVSLRETQVMLRNLTKPKNRDEQ